jgi:hypothetical protein
MLTHALLEALDSALEGRMAPMSVDVRGEWSQSLRAVDAVASAHGSGAASADVIDRRWRGTLTASAPIVGLAFLHTPGGLDWIKAPAFGPVLPVEVCLSAYAGGRPNGATLRASLGGASLPGLRVPSIQGVVDPSVLVPAGFQTGRVSCLARTENVAFLVLILPREVVTMGRHRLWRVREALAQSLPPDVRQLLTRRRTGNEPL